ncbi:TPA: AAA family ATPase [Candidatus Woesearchaeota archaeon]|nr:AAA family ATPase [Candidatus Woesearchaeota archaeon]
MYSYTATSNPYEDENRILKETVTKLKEELEKFKTPPLMVSEVRDILGENIIIRIPNGNLFYVNVSNDCDKLFAGDLVLTDQKNLTIINKVPVAKHFNVEKFVIVEKPNVSWESIGGLDEQIREVKEVVELPLKKPELFKKVGIQPPKGILFYGEPGTGKTLLAKAVAASTNSTFIEVVGSELVQKFIGEGAKLIKDIFELARKKAPSIVFIDEIDALAAKRVELGTSGEREVNRTFMQLLAELDGFKPLDNVKIIGATNRKDILDPAITRPGRLDRLISVPKPDKKSRISVLRIHSRNMSIDPSFTLEEISDKMDDFSGAEIKASCTEAGYFAIRDSRIKITRQDFLSAIEKIKRTKEIESDEYKGMFG